MSGASPRQRLASSSRRISCPELFGSTRNQLIAALEVAGWNCRGQKSRVHDLRHTAVALWIAAGASPNEVASRRPFVGFGRSRQVRTPSVGSEERVNAARDALASRACEPKGRRDRGRIAHAAQKRAIVTPGNALRAGKIEWALADSNRRPQPCEGFASGFPTCTRARIPSLNRSWAYYQ